MPEKACRNCRFIVKDASTCPVCQGSDLTDRWVSYVLIFDPANSELAKKMGAKAAGKYAVRIK